MPSTLRASWLEVTQPVGAPIARSSHAVAVVGKNAYVFGGEFEPRVPIDNLVHVFNLESRTWSIAETTGEAPLPRVGVTMAAVNEVIYLFGGRDKEHEELNEFFSFNTGTGEWKLLTFGHNSPPHRSYHAMTADQDRQVVYTFGGCGKDGRLNDLWEFEIRTGQWKSLPAPLPPSNLVPRGGPGLAAVNNAVWVIFGFCGHELTDIHKFDVEKSLWQEMAVVGEKPTGRSVFGTAVVGQYLVIFGGEVDPSEEGHMGAGSFSDELFVLNTENCLWIRPEVILGDNPGARGWYASSSFGNSMLVYGGNSESNDRLDDLFVLTLEI